MGSLIKHCSLMNTPALLPSCISGSRYIPRIKKAPISERLNHIYSTITRTRTHSVHYFRYCVLVIHALRLAAL